MTMGITEYHSLYLQKKFGITSRIWHYITQIINIFTLLKWINFPSVQILCFFLKAFTYLNIKFYSKLLFEVCMRHHFLAFLVHSLDFINLTLKYCIKKLKEWMKASEHQDVERAFTLVWILWCLVSTDLWLKVFPHPLHS